MLAAFSVFPSGGPTGDSGHEAVADAVRVVRDSGLPSRTDSMFTTVEGDWDEVFEVIHRAADAASRYGERVDLSIKADIRPGHKDELTRKVARLEQTVVAQEKDYDGDLGHSRNH